MTLLGFVVGLGLVGIGFLMVWKTHRWQEYVGSLNYILGYPRLSWLDWDTLGVILMISGVLTMFGLFQAFLTFVVSKLFATGQLR
jgi:hypothetical protein